jgi:hypothetical protein
MGDHLSSSNKNDPVSHLTWPDGVKASRPREMWFSLLGKLPPRLTLREAARALKEPYASVSFWCKKFRYPFEAVKRGRKTTIDWDAVDWARKNCDLARELGVSGERVRQVRLARDLPPTQKHSGNGNTFRDFVRAHRRRLNRMSIRQMIAECGAAISTATAHTVLKKAGIRLRPHMIPWGQVNWELGDVELAQIWCTDVPYVARVRRKKLGERPHWDGDAQGNLDDPAHERAVAQEREKARKHGRRNS